MERRIDLSTSTSSESSTDSSSDSSSKSKNSSQSSALTISTMPGSSQKLSGNSNQASSTLNGIKRSINGTSSISSSSNIHVEEEVDPLDVRLLDDLLGIKQTIACEFCGKKLQKKSMKKHMENIHGEGKPGCVVECGQCDKRIILSDLSSHVLNYHLGLEENSPILSEQSSPSSKHPSIAELLKNKLEPTTVSDGQYLNNPRKNGEKSGNVSMVECKSGTDLFFDSDDDSEKDDDIDIVSKYSINDVIPREGESPASIIRKHSMNDYQEKEKKVEIKSFLNDVSDDTDDSDIVIEEIIPSAAKVKLDENHNRLLKPSIQPVKVQFLIKCKEKSRSGGKVKSMRLVMRDIKTVGQAKRKYSNKQELDKNRIGELQFVMEGVILADEDKVEKLNQKVVMARQLCFLGTK